MPFLLVVLLVLQLPQGSASANSSKGPHGCCSTETSCCCGAMGGCGMCSSSERRSAQEETGDILIKAAKCPGPLRESASVLFGHEYVVPLLAQFSQPLDLPAETPRSQKILFDLFSCGPEPPPPRPSQIF